MKIQVTTNHHYYESKFFDEKTLFQEFNVKLKSDQKALKDQLYQSTFELNTCHSTHSQIKIIGFKKREYNLEEDNHLILKLYSKELDGELRYAVQTGLFAGIVFHKDYLFNITTSYGDVLLTRMLNFVNDIYVDTKDRAARPNKKRNEFQVIIAYLFIQSLEKAGVLGLPKKYQNVTERSTKVRGKIDINAYLKKDIPFQGSLTSTFRSQLYVQEIVDVLYAACIKVEEHFGTNYKAKIMGLFQTLKEFRSKSYISHNDIQKAKSHSILHNPLYSQFKEVLFYAEILLKNHDIEADAKQNHLRTKGYLFDISQLFEVYLEKLLGRHFTEWEVNGQEELRIYSGLFYGRRMLPDIVMRNRLTDEIIVFDAKFKKMDGLKNDLDRSDLFQIHTYIQYYGTNVVLGGLIYPLSEKFKVKKSVSESLFGNERNEIQFAVEGIYVDKNMTSEELLESENQFLERIENLIEVKRNRLTNAS